MATVSVIYPATPGSRFDMEYYVHTHMRTVQACWGQAGLRGYQVLKGLVAPGAAAPAFAVITNLDFSSVAAFEAAAATPDGQKIMADVPNFTDIQPILQISDIVDSHGSGATG